MTLSTDLSLERALAMISLPGVLIGHRLIAPGDEHALMPNEATAFAASVIKVQRASGAARKVARQLLAQLGLPECELPKGHSGAPVWPSEIVGSLAHDARVAIAAIGKRRDYRALGIDVEPAEALPADLLEMVATPRERMNLARDPYRGRLLFVAKEAVYKAVHPLDGIFLEHHDVQVDLAERVATVRNGRMVQLRFCFSTHLIALAFIPDG